MLGVVISQVAHDHDVRTSRSRCRTSIECAACRIDLGNMPNHPFGQRRAQRDERRCKRRKMILDVHVPLRAIDPLDASSITGTTLSPDGWVDAQHLTEAPCSCPLINKDARRLAGHLCLTICASLSIAPSVAWRPFDFGSLREPALRVTDRQNVRTLERLER
jgi:hypothetical protein